MFTSFEHSKQPAANEEAGLSVHCGLRHRHSAPEYHLNRDPDIRSKLFPNDLRREFREQERTIEYGHAVVVVVRVEPEVL